MADSTKKIDLEHDVTVNGVTYKAGEGVSVPSAQAKDIQRINDDAVEAGVQAGIHHGAVPAPAYPEEATAQTPTRPLGAPNLRQDTEFATGKPVGPVKEVDDKGVETVVEDVEARKAEFEAEQTKAPENENTEEVKEA